MTRRSMLRLTRTAAVLEAFNVCWLALLVFVVAGLPASIANLVGYAVLGGLLFEGAAYWTLKHRQLRSGARCPNGLVAFRVLRRVNEVVLASVLVVLAIVAARRPGLETWPGLAFLAFAGLEYINYFHVQLSHQSRADLRRLLRTRRLRTAHLATDLVRCRDRKRAARAAPGVSEASAG